MVAPSTAPGSPGEGVGKGEPTEINHAEAIKAVFGVPDLLLCKVPALVFSAKNTFYLDCC